MTGSASRYFMHIHNMSQQRIIVMLEATFPQGPRHQEVWTSSITITSSANGRGLGIHTAVASSKQAARDAASLQALLALGVDVNNLS